MKYKSISILIFVFLFSAAVTAQDVLQLLPSDGTESTELVAQIIADTLANGGIPANRVYELQSGQVYLASQTLYVPNGKTLHLRSDGEEKATVYLYPTGTGDNPLNPPGYLFRTNGGDLTLEGLAITGYFEPNDEWFWNIQGGMFSSQQEGSSFIFDNCIFSNTRGQVLRTNTATKLIKVTNCIFTNLGSLGGSNFGAGKGIDLREASCERLIVQNNTFTNYQDRIIRHYNFGNPLEGTGNIEYALIDHNTFYSGMGFHGLLSLGNVGEEVHITNNLFVDAFSAGEDPTDGTRTAEWANTGETYANGNNRMSWIFTAPNETTEWDITNNYYSISSEGQAFFDAHTSEPITEGDQLSQHIQGRLGGALDAAFTKIDDPGFTNTQDLLINLMEFYVDPAGGNKTKETGAWVREEDDMDRRPLSFWMNDFDVSYSTSSAAYSGGENGFPAGDLNYFPSAKEEWMRVGNVEYDIVELLPSDGTESTELVAQIIADTLANGGIPANRVYELQSGQVYLASQTLYVPNGKTLHLRSDGEEKATVYLYPTGTGDNPLNPPGYLFRTNGGDLTLEGLAITGYFEPNDEWFWNIQGGMFSSQQEGSSFIFDNCIFSNTRGQVLRTNTATKLIKVTNCIFTNLGSLGGSNFGAGKGIDLREASCERLIVQNNTFTNYQDRIIRHYNFGNPLEGTGNIEYALIDHNTFYSGMGFHGLLSLGNVGEEVHITNNLFVDAFSAGEDPTDGTRTAEWANTGETYANGNNRMSWIFTAPNETTEWNITNNYYAISSEGQAFFDAHTSEPITEGDQLSQHIQGRLGGALDAAFTKIDDPGFTNTQDLLINLMEFYVDPAGGNKTKETGAWVREEDDMDRRPLSFWMNDFDVSYSTSSAAYSGAIGGYPAGDLNYFPDKKDAWDLVDVEEEDIVVSEYQLSQNYPNPFNPSTRIAFSIPEAGNVTLTIYNALGQAVARLIDGEINAGNHVVEFNASNLSSGIYFYQMQSGGVAITKKMMLLK